jgi:NAD(P)-dependent dehydrogenase (short-subunit alcohol dehydrogenase family)
MPEQSKNVIVTGAAGGMGAAVVRQLAARGVNVVAVDVVADRLDQLKRELKDKPGEVDPVVADVGSARAVEGFEP